MQSTTNETCTNTEECETLLFPCYKSSHLPNPPPTASQEANPASFLNSILMAVNQSQITVTPPHVLAGSLSVRIFLLTAVAPLLLDDSLL